MHCLYLGVVKKLMSFWFDAEFYDHPSSLFVFIKNIDKLMNKIVPPSFVERLPRKIYDYASWKAHEYKVFLMVYSLLVLKNIMAKNYFEHLILIVYSIILLNSSSVSDEMIDLSRILLTEYVQRFKLLYGEKFMSRNKHLLLQLPDEVKKFGPLWVMSCFPYENYNGILKKYVHGSKSPKLQISSAVNSFWYFSKIKDKYLREDSLVRLFCDTIEKSGTHRQNFTKIDKTIYAVGKMINGPPLSAEIKNILNSHNISFFLRTKMLHFQQYID